MRASGAAAVAVLGLVAGLGAQAGTRRAVALTTLVAHPGFYHQRPVLTVGDLTLANTGVLRISDGERSLIVVSRSGVPDGPGEVRGEFWDLGRMNADDPRLAVYDLRRTFQLDMDAPWPRPGELLAIIANDVTPASPPLDVSVRALVLFPSRYLDQRVTITGQFAGNNLLGDLPDAPANSRWDFVIRSADAAIWVSNIRPRGRDFELSLDARLDTGRWVEVSGTVHEGRGLQWIDAEPDSLKIVEAPTDTTESNEPIRIPLGPPPQVVFSAPIDGEIAVDPRTSVRIQFSRDIDASTFSGRVQVTYADAAPAPVGQFSTQYRPGNRVLEIAFAAPLEPFRRVRVELTEGVLGTDKQALAPWSLEFETTE